MFLLILGAGADRTDGIDFPLVNALLPEIAKYLKKDGKHVDKYLRQALPRLRSPFNKLYANAIEKIITREPVELQAIIEHIKEVLDSIIDEDNVVKNQGKLIIKLFEKFIAFMENKDHIIDDETYNLIKDAFGNAAAEKMVDDDSIFNINKMSLSDTIKSVLKQIVHEDMDQSNPVANVFAKDMLNIEQLLIEKFLGFYNNKSSEIKNYIYIAWSLWAYLVHRQKLVFAANNGTSLPFYNTIPKGAKAITLNYTSFISDRLGSNNTIFFHGNLAEYLDMDTRDLIRIEKILDCDPVTFLQNNVIPNIKINDDDNSIKTNNNIENSKYVIPSFVPPFKLKPILSYKYIELWHKAFELCKSAKKIIIVGYSFNNADEHFNDILRKNRNQKIDIVDPNADSSYFKQRIKKVLSVPIENYSICRVQGHKCLHADNIRLIKACANEVVLDELFNE